MSEPAGGGVDPHRVMEHMRGRIGMAAQEAAMAHAALEQMAEEHQAQVLELQEQHTAEVGALRAQLAELAGQGADDADGDDEVVTQQPAVPASGARPPAAERPPAAPRGARSRPGR